MEWTAERNPDREYNFRIRELGAGRFAVVSDSERFGADQVVFESFRRCECVDYVTQRRRSGQVELLRHRGFIFVDSRFGKSQPAGTL